MQYLVDPPAGLDRTRDRQLGIHLHPEPSRYLDAFSTFDCGLHERNRVQGGLDDSCRKPGFGENLCDVGGEAPQAGRRVIYVGNRETQSRQRGIARPDSGVEPRRLLVCDELPDQGELCFPCGRFLSGDARHGCSCGCLRSAPQLRGLPVRSGTEVASGDASAVWLHSGGVPLINAAPLLVMAMPSCGNTTWK